MFGFEFSYQTNGVLSIGLEITLIPTVYQNWDSFVIYHEKYDSVRTAMLVRLVNQSKI